MPVQMIDPRFVSASELAQITARANADAVDYLVQEHARQHYHLGWLADMALAALPYVERHALVWDSKTRITEPHPPADHWGFTLDPRSVRYQMLVMLAAIFPERLFCSHFYGYTSGPRGYFDIHVLWRDKAQTSNDGAWYTVMVAGLGDLPFGLRQWQTFAAKLMPEAIRPPEDEVSP
jgi:hypothetical protein